MRIIERVLVNQFTAPGRPWDGTYRRATQGGRSARRGAKVWEHYDPNWRQFIGTTFALILIEFEPRLPADLPTRMVDSMRRAVEGEIAHQLLTPDYTNIALMHGFLWGYAGTRLSRSEWVAAGEDWAEIFAVSDDHPGLKRAIIEVLPEAYWQRCYVRFLRNALDYLPRKVADDCLIELRSALRST